MKHFFAALILATSVMPAAAQDNWNGPDKKLHFAVSAVLGLAAVSQWPDNKPKAFAIAMIPGFLKEVSDAQSGGSGFSRKDLVADALGAAFGVYAGGLLISRAQGTTKIALFREF